MVSLVWLDRLRAVGPVRASQALARRLGLMPGAQAAPVTDGFDSAHGVQTSGFVGWRALSSGRASDAFNAGYLPVDEGYLSEALEQIGDPARLAFVDIGCGKGRALLVAARKPFRALMGVEISPTLVAIAKENACTAERPIEIFEGDAAEFDFPAGPLVAFMYHPFEAPIMRRVIDRLEASLATAPREAFVIYVNPKLAALVSASGVLERQAGGAEHYAIWRTKAQTV